MSWVIITIMVLGDEVQVKSGTDNNDLDKLQELKISVW